MIYKKFVAFIIAGFTAVLLLQSLLMAPLQALEASPLVDILAPTTALDRESDRPEGLAESDDPLGGARAIIGSDEREPVLSRAYPWSTVGRLEWQFEGSAVSSCTATLVHPDVILTNSHCLLLPIRSDGSDQPTNIFVDASRYSQFVEAATAVPKLIFKPSTINGIALDEATVIEVETGWTIDDNAPTKDWALMRLDRSLGDKYGYLGWRDLDLSDGDVIEALFERTALVGYSGDFPTESLREFGQPAATAGVDRACSILGLWKEGPLTGTIAHDCDTNFGASGGPILAKFANGEYYIVGLHARQTPLDKPVLLPNGTRTRIVNGGVQVHQWAERSHSEALSWFQFLRALL